MEFFKSKIMKKFYATLLTIVFVFSLWIPGSAIAQTGTLGSETPQIIATFTNSTGDICDGNNLESGEYNIQLMLSGMSYVSLFQITADVTNDITINSWSTVADTNNQFSVAVIEYEDNNFKAVILSENDDTTAVSSSGEAMITLNVTVNNAGDFERFFEVSNDPDLTYIEADFGDGYEACYVSNVNTSDDIHFAKIIINMSPDLSVSAYDVTGQITIATNVAGTEGTTGIIGITASLDVDGETITATSDADGYYTIPNLPEGEYTVTYSGPTTVDRTATLVVSADKAVDGVINVGILPINVCDYIDDDKINSFDNAQFNRVLKGEYNIYYDIIKDNKVNSFDGTMFKKFLNQNIVYADVEL